MDRRVDRPGEGGLLFQLELKEQHLWELRKVTGHESPRLAGQSDAGMRKKGWTSRSTQPQVLETRDKIIWEQVTGNAAPVGRVHSTISIKIGKAFTGLSNQDEKPHEDPPSQKMKSRSLESTMSLQRRKGLGRSYALLIRVLMCTGRPIP